MGLFDTTFAAFTPFAETIEWKSARGNGRGSFVATVLHGQSMSESAGPSRGAIPADPWTVMVDADSAIVANVKAGDTLKRVSRFDQVLNVQQITRDNDIGWVLVCTANERSPK